MSKNLEIVHPYAAEIDIGSRNFHVDAGEEEIKSSKSNTERNIWSAWQLKCKCN
jgi:hypothetical protein